MNKAVEAALLERCRMVVVRWAEQQFSSYLQYLEAGLLRGALATQDESDQLVLFRQHKRMAGVGNTLSQRFCTSVEKDLELASLSHTELSNIDSGLQDLRSIFMESCGYNGARFCNQLQGPRFTEHCRNALRECEVEPVAEAFALGLFHEYFLATLPDLYGLLNTSLMEQLLRPAASNGLDTWIEHLENLLSDHSLEAHRRSMAQARLDELRQQKADALGRAPDTIAQRWYTPYPENQPRVVHQYTDRELLEQSRKLFRPLLDSEKLPGNIRQASQRLYPLVTETALADRELFMSPLHPLRQLINHMTATVTLWGQSGTDEQEQMLATLQELAHNSLRGLRASEALLEQLRDAISGYCNEAGKLIGSAENEDNTNSPASDEMRAQVQQLLHKKMAGQPLPPPVTKLLLGPWTDVILEHWQKGSSNSRQLKQSVATAEAVLRYSDAGTSWTKAHKQLLERQLQDGLLEIGLERDLIQQHIISLHKLRLHLEKQPHSESAEQLRLS